MMKYILIAFMIFCVSLNMGYSQEYVNNKTYPTDSVNVSNNKLTYDSLMNFLGTSVSMNDALSVAMKKNISKNRSRNIITGYRIRIYFDNSQNARTVSQNIADTFAVHYPTIPVYRTYVNPYFKVTVGDFRTRSDAMRFLEAIRKEYPTVFLVREPFSTI